MFARPWLTLAFFLALSASAGFLFATPTPAHAEAGGIIYIIDRECCGGSGGLIRVDPSQPVGSNQTVVSSGQHLSFPNGVVLSSDGKLYVADLKCCTGGKGGVIRIDPSQPANNNQTIISYGQNFAGAVDASIYAGPSDITVAGDGKLYVVDGWCCGGAGGVIRVDPSLPANSNQTVVSNGQQFTRPVGVAIGLDLNPIVVDREAFSGHGGVFHVQLNQPANTNAVATAAGINMVAPYGIRAGYDGVVYIVDPQCCGGDKGGVIRIDPFKPGNANQTVISAGQFFDQPLGVSLAADGLLYVVDANSGLIRVNPNQPSGSNQTVVSAGQHFLEPSRLAVVPSVSIGDATVIEGTATNVDAVFTITLDPWSQFTVAVPVTPTSGSATVNVDFDGTPRSVTFSPGHTSATVTVPVWGDAKAEPTETYSVILQPPAGVGVGDGPGTGTILDNDGLAMLSINNTTMTEGNNGTKLATFTVTMAPASGQVVTVNYATSDGTAQASIPGLKRDYEPVNNTLTFQSGDTSKTIAVTVNSDVVDEPNETFTVTLSAPTGGAALGDGQGTGTITDDDAPMACSPRPNVVVTQKVADGKLQVHVASSPLNNQQPNSLAELKFGTFQNAKVTMNGQPVSSNETVSVPGNASTADFVVERQMAGQPTTVPLSVVDGCGEWKTFVGAGIGAGL